MRNRKKSLIDSLIIEVEYALGTIYDDKSIDNISKPESIQLNKAQSTQSEKIMRINHMGEVCAQALYRGQAAFTKDEEMRKKLYQI